MRDETRSRGVQISDLNDEVPQKREKRRSSAKRKMRDERDAI